MSSCLGLLDASDELEEHVVHVAELGVVGYIYARPNLIRECLDHLLLKKPEGVVFPRSPE